MVLWADPDAVTKVISLYLDNCKAQSTAHLACTKLIAVQCDMRQDSIFMGFIVSNSVTSYIQYSWCGIWRLSLDLWTYVAYNKMNIEWADTNFQLVVLLNLFPSVLDSLYLYFTN